MFNKLISYTSLIIIAGLFSTSALAFTPLSSTKLVVFGDSLSDQGYQDKNPDVIAAGKRPIFTTKGGNVWPHYLKKDLGLSAFSSTNNEEPIIPTGTNYVSGTLTGTNYAAGGAISSGIANTATEHYSPPSTAKQITAFLEQNNGVASPDNLYVLWIGSNNFLDGIFTTPPETIMEDLLADIKSQVAQLKAAGATHIVVVDLPDLGATPLAVKLNASTKLTQASEAYDALLQAMIKQYYPPNSDGTRNVLFLDAGGLLRQISQQPLNIPFNFYGMSVTLKNVSDPACTTAKIIGGETALTCTSYETSYQNYVFDDMEHPTDLGHQMMAQYFSQAIASPYFI
jgi:outer membrane lipase/esterase